MKKRIFCFIMAAALLCAVSAPVQAADYTDQAAVQYPQSVQLLSSLHIISGFPDGSFRPSATVTRGQMAKIIAALVLGPAQAEALQPGSGVFLDVDMTANHAPHWASKYIYWCYEQKILHGDSVEEGGRMTTFRPDDAVTGAEAAKMLLVALGYQADFEDLVGENWNKNTVELAKSVGIFSGYTTDTAAAIRRDAVCLLCDSALQAYRVESYQTDENGATKRIMSANTLLQTTFPEASSPQMSPAEDPTPSQAASAD